MNEKTPKNRLADFFDQIREASVVDGGMKPLHNSIAEIVAGGSFNLCNSGYHSGGGGSGSGGDS